MITACFRRIDVAVAAGRWLVLVAALSAAAPAMAAADCAPRDGIKSICGLVAPEDLVRAPNGRDLVFGQMHGPGGLYVLDVRDDSIHPLYPATAPAVAVGELWGDARCTEPPAKLHAHGLDLRQRSDGRWQLLVVNHSGREAVEFFELVSQRGDHPVALWRGCAVAPAEGNLNDVVALTDGSFLVSHMANRNWQMWWALLAMLGLDSGWVYHWTAGEGYRPVAGTEGRFPNGLTLAPDGSQLFVNYYFGNEVRKYALPGFALQGSVAVTKPDNGAFDESGQLLVASHHASLLDLLDSLEQAHDQPSELPFSIVRIDPDSLASEVLLRREGPPMGAGTVALQRGGNLYVGSYVGDRIIRLPMPGKS